MRKIKPIVLIILDGWGLSPLKEGNAVAAASTPCFDYLRDHYPYFVLDSAGASVGLSWGFLGNSEVGHEALGTGQIIYQHLVRINMAIKDGSFFTSPALNKAAAHVKKMKSRLHLLGLYSPSGVHAYCDHLEALLRLCKEKDIKEVFLHLFADGRDTPPYLMIELLPKLKEPMQKYGVGKVATLMGRFYAMDRNENWERTNEAYKALTVGSLNHFASLEEAIANSYAKKISDEFIVPAVICDSQGEVLPRIQKNDAVVFFNFREDRARQLTLAFTAPLFKGFRRPKLKNLFFVSFTDYGKDIPVSAVAFSRPPLNETIGSLVSKAGMRQMRIAETEKWAHVTYFFNGGSDIKYRGEDRTLVPSPSVVSFAEAPGMSAAQITENVLRVLKEGRHTFLVVNFANPDMVGHTGNFKATVQAVSLVDKELRKIFQEIKKLNGTLLLTADHGNAEERKNIATGEPSKEHATNPVPFIVVNESLKKDKSLKERKALKKQFQPVGILPDVTATALKFLNIKKPKSFIGQALV